MNMMYSIEVRARFDFLHDEISVGTLECERIKGNASFRFQYDNSFLQRFPKLTLSADLGNFQGIQAKEGSLFGFIGDTLPDRWGRALIDKRERLIAADKKQPPRVFDDFGYLARISDLTRTGALRFVYNKKYLGITDFQRTVPPITSLDSFTREAQLIEEAERKGLKFQKEWIDNVWLPGSSLGGARPKLNVVDENGNFWIAKIPSVNDNYDVGLWEHFALSLAREAGINTASSTVLRVGPTPYHTLLSKRFDRNGDKRIHFASSLTLTGLRDGDNASNGKGYIDIVDAMAGDIGIASLEENCRELFRRVTFNILIGNHDDHFRNHGFLLTPNGWMLSPAYDLNPTNERTQVLEIAPHSNQSSIRELYEASDYYLVPKSAAEEIIRQVLSAVTEWKRTAARLRIPEAEQDRFAARFTSALRQAKAVFPAKAAMSIPTQVTTKKKKSGLHL